jgi:Cu2+-exporting ATPase
LPTEALQAVAVSLAGWSHHPLAQSLVRTLAAAPMAWRSVLEETGCGVEGVDAQGRRWRLGAAPWVGPCDAAGGVAQVLLGCDGRALLRFTFDERLRRGAAAALRALRADGVQVHLLSGDGASQVQRLAARLELDSARGGLRPEDKLAAVQAAQAGGLRVAMLGDGINDAPVLARADVSFAMGEGAAIARAQADGVLVSNRLQDFHAARTLAQRALRIARQNLAWAGLYNLACVPLALAGLLPPWLAALGMASSSLAVVLNALRLAR